MRTMTVLVAATLSLAGTGCCQKAGAGVGRGVTGFTEGVGKGADEELLVNVKFMEEATRLGLASTTAKWAGKKIQLYLTSKTPFNGQLIAKAINKEGNEIGRSILPVTMGANDAKYIAFAFPSEMDTQLVQEYRVDVMK